MRKFLTWGLLCAGRLSGLSGYETICLLLVAGSRHEMSRGSGASSPESDLEMSIVYATTFSWAYKLTFR